MSFGRVSAVHDAKSVRHMLKRLYLCVHPDLFGKYPEKQLVNQASFKELQSAVDDYLAEGREVQKRGERKVEFYVRCGNGNKSNEAGRMDLPLPPLSFDEPCCELTPCGAFLSVSPLFGQLRKRSSNGSV